MEAYIEVHGSTEGLDRIQIVNSLRQKGISYGILYDVIDDLVKGNYLWKPVLIAKGKKMVDGSDGWYEYFFRTHVARTPKQFEDGNVDYRSVEWYETEKKP